MKYNEVQRLSKVTNKHTMYVELGELPSKFRFYPKDIKIFVRRLTFKESFDMAQLIEESGSYVDVSALARIYEDVIVSDNPDFSLYDLEFVDFQLAIAVSTIWTAKKAGWKLDIARCPNMACKASFTKNITLDDFEFSDDANPVPVPIQIGEQEFNIIPLTVKGYLNSLKLKKEHPEISKNFADLLAVLEPINKETIPDMISAYNYLKDQEDIELVTISQIIREIDIKNYPIKVKCPHCGEIVSVNKQLVDLKVYL